MDPRDETKRNVRKPSMYSVILNLIPSSLNALITSNSLVVDAVGRSRVIRFTHVTKTRGRDAPHKTVAWDVDPR